jgi:CAAX protease family protein
MWKFPNDPLRLDWKIAVLTIGSTLLLMIDHYHYPLLPWGKIFPWWEKTGISAKVLDRTVLYFLVPMIVILVFFRENPREFGFSLGNWKTGLLLSLSGMVLIAPILLIIGKVNISMQNYYQNLLSGLPWNTFLDLFGWEFMFRGWLLFGYARKFGPEALWLQAVPFALAHIGKPEVETLSTIFGGFAFGWVAWKTKSFLYPLLIHWFVASFTILVASGYIG